MLDKLNAFFNQFCEDFRYFNGEVIAARYHEPYLAVSDQGRCELFLTRTATANYFQTVLEGYKNQGIVSCGYTALDWLRTGASSVTATVTWQMFDATGKAVLTWRESYHLIEQDDLLLVYSSADF